MVATLYDASLDQFMSLSWQQRFGFFRQDYSSASAVFENTANNSNWLGGLSGFRGRWTNAPKARSGYRSFRMTGGNFWGYERCNRARGMVVKRVPLHAAGACLRHSNTRCGADEYGEAERTKPAGGAMANSGEDASWRRPLSSHGSQEPERDGVLLPATGSDSNGVVRMTFTMPEALTEWKFMGFAHDRNLRSGYFGRKSGEFKRFDGAANPPRFVREGDLIEFTVKVSNQTTNRQGGRIRLTFNNAVNGESFDAAWA